MFDHLDDPHPPDLAPLRDPVLVSGGRRRRHRRWGQSLASIAVVVAVVGAGLGLVDRRLASVDRVQVDVGTPPSVGAGPVTVLLVGTDRGIEGVPADASAPRGSPIRSWWSDSTRGPPRCGCCRCRGTCG